MDFCPKKTSRNGVKMECAGKGRGTRCVGPPRRRCSHCGAVAYCSVTHQVSHWSVHKEECARLEQQMGNVDVLNDFPFEFSEEATYKICENQETRCSFLSKRGIHRLGMWIYECSCGAQVSFDSQRICDSWDLPSTLCPCKRPISPLSKTLADWEDYYEWRNIPLHSPVSLLLQWPLLIYHAIQLAGLECFTLGTQKKLQIHYLGPEKELGQLGVFAELQALLPGVQLHIKLVGPAISQHSDGLRINLSSYPQCTDIECTCKSSTENTGCPSNNNETFSDVTLQLHRGLYHDIFSDITKDSLPDLIIAPNAGVAAYSCWLPTVELIRKMNVPAIVSDYCEEACHLAARCINASMDHPLRVPIQLNPFRQPLVVEESALLLPCYSNCYLFGI